MKNINSHKKNRRILVIMTLAAISTSAASTADYYKCNHREGGEWNYGRAPNVCDAKAFGDDQVVLEDYRAVIFQDNKSRTAERDRYMTELNAVIRDAAAYYLKKRKPQVSSEELNNWILGIMTTASQESYWSHYRSTTDGRLKMMRGDFGHGHGMMQIDDRSHFDAIGKGYGWNLANHFSYAMDIFYKAWERAPSQSCVNGSKDYKARIRSAWAAYNGGPSKICRWANSNDAWAQNDQAFYSQLTNRRWTNYVESQSQKSKIDIGCLMENETNCSSVPAPAPSDKWTENQLYSVDDGRVCLFSDGRFQCLQQQKDRLCLQNLDTFDSESPLSITSSVVNRQSPQMWDRHQLCRTWDPSLMKVGDTLITHKNINIRSSPGSGILAVLPTDSILTVLDFEIRNQETQDRYYKVRYQNYSGFIFAGNKSDFKEWASPAPDQRVSQPIIARANQKVRINAKSGINLRATPGGNLITTVPSGSVLSILEVVIRNSENEVYYRVRFNGSEGFIYSGQLLPEETTADWTSVLP